MQTEQRLVPLQGGRNFRDLGGYEAHDGRCIKWGRLFRSGSMTGLTQADWQSLSARGVRAVCDFRTTRERESEPFQWRETPGLSYFSRDYETSFGELRRVMQMELPSREAARQAMFTGYRELPFEQAPAYRRLFAHLKAGETPLIFNCSAGKDRAGTAAALVLSALGVSQDQVIADFVLTDQIGDLHRSMKARADGASTLARQPPEVVEAILKADPDYIVAGLESARVRHGSINAYLNDVLEVDDAALTAIADHLLD